MDRKRNEDGFTIVELMTVVAILAILVAIAIVSYTTAVNSAEAATCSANRAALDRAVQIYAADHNDSYPTTMTDLQPYVVNYGAAHKCPSGAALSLDPTTHDVVCPVHGQ